MVNASFYHNFPVDELPHGYFELVSHGHTPFHKRGKGFGNLKFLRLHNYLGQTDTAAAHGFTVDLHLVISY